MHCESLRVPQPGPFPPDTFTDNLFIALLVDLTVTAFLEIIALKFKMVVYFGRRKPRVTAALCLVRRQRSEGRPIRFFI